METYVSGCFLYRTTGTSTLYFYPSGMANDLSGMDYPSGLGVTYSCNGNGAILGISINNQPIIRNIEYRPFGPVTNYDFGSGLEIFRVPDQRYNLTEISSGDFKYSYTHDLNGRVKTISGLVPPDPSAENTTLNYEANSSRRDNQTGSVAKEYTLDANGYIISDGTLSFEYNALNNLTKVVQGTTVIAEYGYDAFNRRVKKTVSGTTTLFQYDLQGNLIGEATEDGTPLRDYVYLNNQPVALVVYTAGVGEYYYYLNDHLGTTQRLVNSQGSTVWMAGYYPYGKAQVITESVTNNLRFPGQYFDQETGLHYNWQRFYDPTTGRYISADPIGLAGRLIFMLTFIMIRLIGLILKGYVVKRNVLPLKMQKLKSKQLYKQIVLRMKF